MLAYRIIWLLPISIDIFTCICNEICGCLHARKKSTKIDNFIPKSIEIDINSQCDIDFYRLSLSIDNNQSMISIDIDLLIGISMIDFYRLTTPGLWVACVAALQESRGYSMGPGEGQKCMFKAFSLVLLEYVIIMFSI